jgi:hypothetical protein
MGNTLQPNPSDPTEGYVQPDWNSAHGQGVEPPESEEFSFEENYDAQRQDAQERAAEGANGNPVQQGSSSNEE